MFGGAGGRAGGGLRQMAGRRCRWGHATAPRRQGRAATRGAAGGCDVMRAGVRATQATQATRAARRRAGGLSRTRMSRTGARSGECRLLHRQVNDSGRWMGFVEFELNV